MCLAFTSWRRSVQLGPRILQARALPTGSRKKKARPSRGDKSFWEFLFGARKLFFSDMRRLRFLSSEAYK